MPIIIIVILVVIIVFLIIKNRSNTTQVSTNNEVIEEAKAEVIETEENLPYIRKNLMTKNEWYFYKKLKPIADKLNLSILCKVRVADLVEVKKGLSKSEWQTAFNRVNKKHVDFVLCKPENLYPELLIELDDSSHENEKVKQRDMFIEKLYEQTGYKLLRVKNDADIENKIKSALEIKTEQ